MQVYKFIISTLPIFMSHQAQQCHGVSSLEREGPNTSNYLVYLVVKPSNQEREMQVYKFIISTLPIFMSHQAQQRHGVSSLEREVLYLLNFKIIIVQFVCHHLHA